FASVAADDVGDAEVRPVTLVVAGGHRFAQLARPERVRVLREPAIDGLLAGFRDPARRRKVRLAGTEVDDIDAFRDELVCAIHHCQCRRHFDLSHAAGEANGTFGGGWHVRYQV